MTGLSTEMHHGQVLGKIGFIKRCMENIDPDSRYSLIRAEYKEELEWSTKRAEDIILASKAGKCPDLDTLGKKALVLQDLMLLIDSVKPFVLNQEMVEAHYNAFKNERNLWDSKFHQTLTVLENLIKSSEASPAPKKHFFKAIIATLKHQIATQGIAKDNAEIKELIKCAEAMKEATYNSFEQQYKIFKAFIDSQSEESSLADSVELEVRQEIIKTILEHSQKLSSTTLKNKLTDLLQSGVINKALLVTISDTIAIDNQLQALAQVALREHRIDAGEIEAIYSDAVKKSVKDPLAYTTEQINKILLCRVYPEHAELIQKTKFASTSPLLAIDVIQAIALKSTSNSESDLAIRQLVTPLKQTHQESSDMSLEQLCTFIDEKSKSIINAVPRKKEQLKLLGSKVFTFDEVEALIQPLLESAENKDKEIIVGFYRAIHNAKIKHFYNQWLDVKQIEQITPADVTHFYKECCDAGQKAANKLAANRPLTTMLVDILRSLANLAIRILSLGSSPQFFKPQATSVDMISAALEEAKSNITSNLDHLNPASELSQTATAART